MADKRLFQFLTAINIRFSFFFALLASFHRLTFLPLYRLEKLSSVMPHLSERVQMRYNTFKTYIGHVSDDNQMDLVRLCSYEPDYARDYDDIDEDRDVRENNEYVGRLNQEDD